MHRRQVSDSRVTLLPSMPWEGGRTAPHASRSLGALLVPPVAARQSSQADLVSFLDFVVWASLALANPRHRSSLPLA